MHSQVLVVYPYDVELADIMYWYQEVDKTQNDKLNDDRCQFFLTVKEDEIPMLLSEIESDLLKDRDKYLEMLLYRSEHTIEDFREEYGNVHNCFNSYIYYQDLLNEFEQIRDLEVGNPKQIQYIKEYGYLCTDKWTDIYIKGKGYGTFHNPYELWDFYTVDTYFLVSKDGKKSNTLYLTDIDIEKTVANIYELTKGWEQIIFCEANPRKSMLYTTDDIRFDKVWNEHCLLDNICCDLTLKDVLLKLQENYFEDYVITALDFHW